MGIERGLALTEAVDVIMLTKNSERLLRRCLASVYENVPVNELIVIDGHSNDSTLEILQEFQRKQKNLTVIEHDGTRGSARQKAIARVKSDWFLFVDSDVVLSDGWFAKASELMGGDVGAIWGIEIWSVVKNMSILGLYERITYKIFEARGGTHDLLVRTDAIGGIKIPSHMHTYEDSYIKSWIIGRGYKVIAAYEPYCVHYRPEEVWSTKQSVRLMASDLKYAVRRPALFLSYAVYTAIVVYQSFLRNFRLTQE
jgi:glycosyltransferase involved in cell wall biosynthesis